MGSHHRFVVGGAHDDTHLVGESWTLGVVFVKGSCPHGWPEVVGFQSQEEFEDVGVGFGVHAAEVVVAPGAEGWPFIVDEDATIFDFWRGLHDAACVVIDFVVMDYGGVGHPIPRTFVTACNDQMTVDHVNEVGFPLTSHLLHVYLLLLDELVDEFAFADGADEN